MFDQTTPTPLSYQVAVFREDEVRLDIVDPHVDGQAVGLEGVLGQVARG